MLLSGAARAQELALDSSLMHEVLQGRMRNAEEVLYREGLQRYAQHLAQHPLDVRVHIERCAFIGTAMYDEVEEYNPNQESHDSCLAALAEAFPDEPKVFLARAEYQWGEEQLTTLHEAEESNQAEPTRWSTEETAELYRDLAASYDREEDGKFKALRYIEKLNLISEADRGSMLSARVLKENGRTEEALLALNARTDTAEQTWGLQQRAALLMELGDHANALRVYHVVEAMDSSALDHGKLADVLEAAGEITLAREHFVRDTANHWSKDRKTLALFEHDLRHHGADTALASYNALRDQGFAQDPLAAQRLRLFVHAPLQPWKARDLGGLLLLGCMALLLALLPYLWVLPVHFIGTRWPRKSVPPPFGAVRFGLKEFWWGGSAYLLASLISVLAVPSVLHSYLSDSFDATGITEAENAYTMLAFVIACAVLTLPLLFRTGLAIYRSPVWSFGRQVGQMLLFLLAFRFVSGIYVRLANKYFPEEGSLLGFVQGLPGLAQAEVLSFLTTYGTGTSLLLLGVLVPIYEEVIFRGAVLTSCTRYLGFRWANALQATLFTAVHGELLLAPYFFLFGILTGMLTKRSQGLLASTLFHVLNNLLAVGVLALRN